MDRLYAYSHAPIDFYFKQSSETFVVKEQPLYDFANHGEHLILHIRKKNLSTLELIDILANFLGIRKKEIGYAGLKDKHALTYQYISIHKKYQQQLEQFSHPQIKILSSTYHTNKIKIGHLKGNDFFIRLKKVNPTNSVKITAVLKQLKQYGMPNFFGYQRFGNELNNHILGEKIAKGKKKERNPKIRKLLVSAYQSHLFNLWLSKRIELSKLIESFNINELESLLNLPKEQLKELKKQQHPFKLFLGDLMQHYPYGRLYDFDGTLQEADRFMQKDVAPTGLLCGKRVKRASGFALEIEKSFDQNILVDGQRRYAWIFPQDINGEYKEENGWFELSFFLPKGSYATTLIEEIAKKKIYQKDKN